MYYTLHQLKIFLKVCENLSISKSAEELHMSQPALSIQLKNFQDQFKIPLYEIIRRKIYITPFGYKIAECSRRILDESERIRQIHDAYLGFLSGELKISSVSTGKYIVPYFVHDFRKKHERIEIKIDVTNKLNVLKTLEKNETDFGLISLLPKNLYLNKIELLPNKLFLVGPYQEEKMQKKRNPDFLKDKTLIFREEGSATRLLMEKFLRKHRIRVSRVLELSSNEAVKQALIAGLGFSVLPLIGLKNEILNKQLKIYGMRDLPIETTWYLVWLKEKKLSPAANAFVNFLMAYKKIIAKKNFGWYLNFIDA